MYMPHYIPGVTERDTIHERNYFLVEEHVHSYLCCPLGCARLS